MGYKASSKAHRAYEIEARQVVVSRDVNFDESTFGLSSMVTDDALDDLDFESLELIDQDLHPTNFTQAGKRKSRPSEADETVSRPRTVRPRPGSEEAIAPENHSPRQADQDEEDKSEGFQDAPSSPVFWHAITDAIEAAVDLSEPS